MTEIPTIEQINRLKKLQGTDAGVFTLAIFSTIEAFLRKTLGHLANENSTFYEMLNLYKDVFSTKNPGEYYLFRQIQLNQRNTNNVRHKFEQLSADEANAAILLFKKFAQMEKLPNIKLIDELSETLKCWDDRKTPVENINELNQVKKQLELLISKNKDMTTKVEELASMQKKLDLVSNELKVRNADYDEQIKRNKNNSERIDDLRKKKHKAELEAQKKQKELQQKIGELNDAQEYISNLSRMACYTKTRYDYEKSLIRLTSEQAEIVNMINFDKDFLIKGSAGTGKSLVLIKTLSSLIEKK